MLLLLSTHYRLKHSIVKWTSKVSTAGSIDTNMIKTGSNGEAQANCILLDYSVISEVSSEITAEMDDGLEWKFQMWMICKPCWRVVRAEGPSSHGEREGVAPSGFAGGGGDASPRNSEAQGDARRRRWASRTSRRPNTPPTEPSSAETAGSNVPSVILPKADQSLVRSVKAKAVTRGIDRLSSTGQEEKSSVRDAIVAPATAIGIVKENASNMKKEEKKKARAPSRDFPRKRTLPNLLPRTEDNGSEIDRIKSEEMAIFFSKSAMAIKLERI